MIVQPDFLDHWKTRMLCDILNDEAAPIYIIRLWSHCQNRKTNSFQCGNPAMIKAICKAPHESDLFYNAIIESGFVKEKDGFLIVHDWDVVNSYLISSWENGKSGGRPKKKTQTKPTGYCSVNPDVTQTKPIREEKSRVEKSNINTAEAADADFQLLKSCKPFAKISYERFCTIKRSFPNVRTDVAISEACLKATADGANVKNADSYLIAFFKNQRPQNDLQPEDLEYPDCPRGFVPREFGGTYSRPNNAADDAAWRKTMGLPTREEMGLKK